VIFANSEVQTIFESVCLGTVVGDYQNGVRSFTLCLPRNRYIPEGDTPKTMPEFEDYHARVRVFEAGYDEASRDWRHQTIHELFRRLLKLSGRS
jgi:hypothetical protein